MLQARALQLQGENHLAEAVTIYRKLIALVPKSPEAHLHLSEALAESASLDEAVEPARRATELAPRNAEAWAHLSKLQLLRARYKEDVKPLAKEALRSATALLPSDVELWTRLAELCETTKDDAGALAAWLHVGRLHPTYILQDRPLWDIAYERASILAIAIGNYEARREAVMALCEQEHPDAAHLKRLGDLTRLQMDKGYYGHAEASLSRLAEFLADATEVREHIATIALRTNRFKEALESVGRIDDGKRTPRARLLQAYALMHLGQPKEAGDCLKELLKIQTKAQKSEFVPNARTLLLTTFLLQDRPQDMLDALKTWAPPQPDQIDDFEAFRIQALIQTGAFKDALSAINAGIEKIPEAVLFRIAHATIPAERLTGKRANKKDLQQDLRCLDLVFTAMAFSEFKRWESCAERLAKAKKMKSATLGIDALLLYATALQELGRSEDALKILREVQQSEPNNALLQNNLGYLLLEMGQSLEEAVRLTEASHKQDPKNAHTMDSWGWALYKQGKFKEAEQVLRDASDLAPDNPETRIHLGEALLKLDRAEEALDQWEQALAYAFPSHAALDKKARDLRAKIAKSKQAEHTSAPVEDDEDMLGEPAEED